MAIGPETRFKQKFMPRLKAIPNSYWYKASDKFTVGIPDIIGVIRGVFVAVELKASAKEIPTVIQLHTLEKIRKAGGIAYVAYPENADDVLDAILSDVDRHARACFA